MKNFKSTTATLRNENEEIKKIFDSQANFLKGLIVLAVAQYIVLLALI